MLLFFKDIPKYTSIKEINKFIVSSRGGLGKIFPFARGFTLVKCEILRLEDRRKKTIEYHGLIEIEPERVGRSLIARLNGGVLLGSRVEVRPFIKRSVYKDRRRLHADLELLPVERRRRDRRRPWLRSHFFRCRRA